MTRRAEVWALGQPVSGYEIHHGRTEPVGSWLELDGVPEGSASEEGNVLGTALHGLFESDGFRRAFLGAVARRADIDWEPGPEMSFADERDRYVDRVADAVDAHLDTQYIQGLLEGAVRRIRLR